MNEIRYIVVGELPIISVDDSISGMSMLSDGAVSDNEASRVMAEFSSKCAGRIWKFPVNKKRTFLLNWKDGTMDRISSFSIGSKHEALADAMNRAGFGGGSVSALDSWEEL